MAEQIPDSTVTRTDAWEKVTGRAGFVADLQFPRMAYIALARSPFPRAKVGVVNQESIEGNRGILAVVTGRDVPDVRYGPYVKDQPVLPRDYVSYEGQPVAAVIAEDRGSARSSARLLDVDLQPLDTVDDLEAALAPNAAQVHPRIEDHADDYLAWRGWGSGNVCHRFIREHGDVDAGFASSYRIFKDSFEVPPVQHAALEPHACVALWTGSQLTVWSATQSPFGVRKDLAYALRLPLSSVVVRAPYVGGGFGGKLYSKLELVGAACALAVEGRPVKLELDAEETTTTITRHGGRIHLKTGVTREGRLVARECLVLLDTGAYADAGPRVAEKAGYRAPGPYKLDNVRSRSYCIYTNRVPAGAFRGFGTPQVAWAYESQMDIIAAGLDMDPVDLRRLNLIPRGDSFDPRDRAVDCDVIDSLDRVHRIASGWNKAAKSTGRGNGETRHAVGVGYAVALKDGGGQVTASSAEVRLEEDGTAVVLVGSTELGQGTTTALAQIAANELGTPLDTVRVLAGDTGSVPYDSGTNASRTIALVGQAVVHAVCDAKAQVIEAFRKRYEIAAEEPVVIQGGNISSKCRSETIVEFLNTHSSLIGGQFLGRGYYRTETSKNLLGADTAFWEPGVAAAMVSVDIDSGSIELVRYVSALDAGRAINRNLCEGQDEGGAIMGMGHALFEELKYSGSQLMNPGFIDYRVPSSADSPASFETILVENLDGPGPYGARGVGEGGVLPVAPAIANAVAQATGVRVHRLPLTPAAVWRALSREGKVRPVGTGDVEKV